MRIRRAIRKRKRTRIFTATTALRETGKNSAVSRQPFRPKSVTYVAGTFCYPCVRVGPGSDPGKMAEEEGFEPPRPFRV